MLRKFSSKIRGKKSLGKSCNSRQIIRQVEESPALEVFNTWLDKDNLLDLMWEVALLQGEGCSTWGAEILQAKFLWFCVLKF